MKNLWRTLWISALLVSLLLVAGCSSAPTATSQVVTVVNTVPVEVTRVVTIFRELRGGQTLDGKTALKVPSGNLSTAEAIAVMVGGLSQAAYFSDGALDAEGLAPNLLGAIVKDPVQDKAVLEEYLETVLKKRRDYAPYYSVMTELL